MAKACGALFLMTIETAVPGTFVDIGGIQTNSLTINNEAVDVTDKGSAGWRELKPECGILSASMSGSGFVTDAAGFDLAHAAMLAKTLVNMEVTSELGDSYEGLFQITSIERSGEYNGAETMSLSLESSSTLVYTAAP